MRFDTINTNTFSFLVHSDVARYPDALATDGRLVTSGAFDVVLYTAKNPPTVAIIAGQTYLVSDLLSLHLNLRVLSRDEFVVAICDPNECSQDADVKRFAVRDQAVYVALIAELTPPTVSRPTEIKTKHMQAGQICPICAVYKRGKIKPLITPLSSAQDWRGVRKAGQGGTVSCRRCGFRVQLSEEEFRKFIEFRLPTAEYVTVKLVDGGPTYCRDCEAKGRRGILLNRHSEGKVVTRCPFCRSGHQVSPRNSEAA